MDPTSALLAGLVAGLAIAAQIGAVSLLLVDTALAAGPRAAVAGGMGVATADFAFGIVAVAAGGAVGAALASHESEIHVVAAATLAAIAAHGLVHLARGSAAPTAGAGHTSGARSYYVRFLAVTAVNPLTVASFAAVAASLSLGGLTPALAFVAGVGIASGGWHLFLTLTAAHLGRWITPAVQRMLGIGGRLLVLAIAVRLALGA